MTAINHVIALLNQQQIIGQRGLLRFELAGVSFPVTSKDIIGGILQEWFENWMRANSIPFSKPTNTQEPPDFFLADGTHLEIKTFNDEASPGFDLANFGAYTKDLLLHPERLDAEHLVFGYVAADGYICIRQSWLKKIWQLAGSSPVNHLSLQVKRGEPVNIRPKDWRRRDTAFQSRHDFVEALNQAIQYFYPQRYPTWLADVTWAYQNRVGSPL